MRGVLASNPAQTSRFARTTGTRGFSYGLEEISTALVRAALTRSYPRECRKGIAVLVLWRAFVRRVVPAFMIVAEFRIVRDASPPNRGSFQKEIGLQVAASGFLRRDLLGADP